MNINQFVTHLAGQEKGKKQVDIAQIKELLRLVNAALWGIPYLLIRLKRKPKVKSC